MATIKVTGSVINATTSKGMADLSVEIWGRTANADNQLGMTKTDADGRFAIEFNISDQALSRQPVGVIRILSGDTLLHTTAEQPIADWTPQPPPFVIELNPPSTSENAVQLFVAASLANGNPADGVQLVMSYELPTGGTWTSQPILANATGKLTVEIPVNSPDSIEWHRANFAFSKNDKPLRVVDKTQPAPAEGGFAISITLAQDTIPWPPEQDPNKWYVRGRVSTANGEAVLANVSADAISLSGEKRLGQVQSSPTGRYEIIYEWDGACLPDVQVTATIDDKLMAQSAIYFAAGKSVRIDLIQNNETYIGPTEFQRVEERILKCNDDFNIADIGARQFDYLLGKTRLAQDTLTFYLLARKLASQCDVPTAVFYGLFRAKLPTSLQGLVLQTPKVLQDALHASIQRNIIDRKYADALGPLIAALRQLAVQGSLNGNQQLDHAGMSDLLTVADVPMEAHPQLVERYFGHDGDNASFWEALHADEQFGLYASKVKLGLQTGALAMYHLPTIEQFKAKLGAEADVKDLAQWQADDWQDFAQSLSSVPDVIVGDTAEERLRLYVDGMQRTIKRAFARAYTTANVLRSDTFSNPILREFLTHTPDFDYRNSSIPAVLDKAGISGEHRTELEKTLKGMQRLYRVAPVEQTFEVVESLFASGVTSSRDIMLQGRAQFIDTYAASLGGADVALQVYQNAATVTALSTHVLTGYSELFNASHVYAIGGGVPVSQPDTQGNLVLPSYQDLFGSQSFCECEHCSSVYSPAAYLVDLLEYLRQSLVTKRIGGGGYVKIIKDGQRVNKTGLDVLFERRADLGDIRLDCKNTNTVLPYIDLVNEIFEWAVAGETDSRPPYQTNWNEAELKTNPEHILSAAYDTLATTTFPLTLPFRFWNVEAEHYLKHLEAPRWKLTETVKKMPDSGNSGFEQICFAYLGLTEIDVDILRGAPAYSGSLAAVGQMWGYQDRGWRSKLARVPEFLQRSELSYDQLQQLLQVSFINVDGQVVIDFSDAESACDIDGAVLRYFINEVIETEPLSRNTFDQMQRFLRLQLKTGWSIWELGRVLHGLSITQLTLKAVTQVAVMKRVADALALDVMEVLSWWTELDTGLDITDPEYRSFYESVFVNPAVLNPPNQAFLLDENDRTQLAVESGGGALISEHLSSIAAALQITESEASLLAETLLGSTGDALTLTHLSQLHRMASLCRAKDIDIEDYLLLERLIGADVWNADQPQALLNFLDAMQSIDHSAFSVSELGYLLLHDAASVSNVQMPAASIAELLTAIQIAVRAVWVRYVISNATLIDQLTGRLGDYFAQEDIDSIVNLVGQQEPRAPEDNSYLEEAMGFLSSAALRQAIDQSLAADARYNNLLILLNRYGRRVSSINVVSQLISEVFALDLSVTQLILTDVVPVSNQPGDFVIDALLEPLFIDSGKEKLAAAIEAEFQQDAFSIIEGTAAMTETEIAAFINLHFDFLDTEEATTKLVGSEALVDVVERYQYVTLPLDAAQFEMTDEIFADQFAAMRSIQKTALLVGKFHISQAELPGLKDYANDLELLPLAGFPFEERQQNLAGFNAWTNLSNLLALRRLFVNSDTDLFAQLEQAAKPGLIDTINTITEIDELIASGQWSEADRPLLVWLDEFATAADWPFEEVLYVAGSEWLNASLPDMLKVPTLIYLTDVIELTARLGTTAAQLRAWSELDVTQTDAANAKQTARARYSLEQWYDMAPSLRDVLREKQRDALTAYMLYQGGFGSTVELYNYYLIDSEMSACMLTSRLKLALSSVQLFLQRCLLNLEDEFVEITRPKEWEWRKNYRVWEANRKVFLYPENYIKPELRLTRSEIFDAAQSILLQNEVTNDVAEQSLLRYLEELDEVSNLEVVSSYHELSPAEDGLDATNRLHVVARTRGVPPKYFYRVRDDKFWSPWEEIDADIGADQVLPIVINRRRYLFWPVFIERQAPGTDVLDQDLINTFVYNNGHESYLDYLFYWVWQGSGGYSVSSEADSLEHYAELLSDLFNIPYTTEDVIELVIDTGGAQTWQEYSAELIDKYNETINYFELKLAVCEYKNGNWTPPRNSEGFFESDKYRSAVALLESRLPAATPSDFHFFTKTQDDVVIIECIQSLRYTDGSTYHFPEGRFEYDTLSKESLAFESQTGGGWLDILEALIGRAITVPTGTNVVANAFVEDGESKFEIPEPEESGPTNFVTLLERTPGIFRVPTQHQYEQFSAHDAFFYGDDKRSYIVSAETGLGGVLDDYVQSEIPKFGVYNQPFSLASSVGSILQNNWISGKIGEEVRALSPASAVGSGAGTASNVGSPIGTEIFDLQTTSVTHYVPLYNNEYRFESFYHPLVGELIRKVNGDGVTVVLSRDTQNTSEDYFSSSYEPTDCVKTPHPIRHFSFTDIDSYGFYNYEFFFHLPLLIAMRLSKNQQFAEAQKWFHTIFNPTSRSEGKGAQRFWQFKPFFDMYAQTTGHPFDSIYDMLTALAADPSSADAETLALKEQTEQQIVVWRANPFDPHAIAAVRPVAYMKTVVMEYLNNLIAWGDYLYEQFTHESINEATLYYILAYQILGDRPVALPELDVAARSYNELGALDAFSNAMAELENLMNLPQTSGTGSATVPPLYFCIPDNPNLLQIWDTVEDRLFKMRHCMTIEGVVQQLPLFQPPIPPELLVQARASGVSIGAALASLATPAPHYRFVYLMQKAVEYCHVVKNLGSQLLVAYEKQDAEGLSLLRAEHEESLLKASTELRNLQVDEARENLSALEKSKVLVEERIEYYSNIEKRSEKETASTKRLDDAERKRKKSSDKEKDASRSNLIPNVSVNVGLAPNISVSLGTSYGGGNLGASLSADAAKHRGDSAASTHAASKLTTDANYDRRWDDWKLQERLAKQELKQVEKQIIAAEIRLALAEKERDNHAIQLEQSREVRDFLSRKFTNQELYGWMVSQTSAIYFQSYKLAYDLAKRCEKAYQRESGEYSSTYIAYGYFDSMKKGLFSGERLHHDLQRMEFDYLNNNRREYELTKHVSLVQLDPSALIALRETGECFISLPEMLFDFDYPGHYFRRIKSVSLTIPSLTGPYTSLSSILTLQSDKIRVTAKMDEGEADDDHFQFNLGTVKTIATSSAQSDSGMFQLDFRDERYLPFEGSGVISEWKLRLNRPELAQFDYGTINDIVIQINYTARDGGDVFRGTVESKLMLAINDYFGTGQELQNLISIKQTMSDEWARLTNTEGENRYRLSVDLGLEHFPYYLRARGITITNLKLALSGEVEVSGWGKLALPEMADDQGNQPYSVNFTQDISLGLPAAGFQLPGGYEESSIDIDLPWQLVGAINGEVDDILILCSYDLQATSITPTGRSNERSPR